MSRRFRVLGGAAMAAFACATAMGCAPGAEEDFAGEPSDSVAQPLTGCQLVSQPYFTYSPLSEWSSEWGRSTAFGYGDREACAKACYEWFGPGNVAPSRSWDHRGMQYYDQPFTTWSEITNDFETANAVCEVQLWSPTAWSVGYPDQWKCPVLSAKEKKIFATVCDGNGCRKEYQNSTFSTTGTYACDYDLQTRRWLTNIN